MSARPTGRVSRRPACCRCRDAAGRMQLAASTEQQGNTECQRRLAWGGPLRITGCPAHPTPLPPAALALTCTGPAETTGIPHPAAGHSGPLGTPTASHAPAGRTRCTTTQSTLHVPRRRCTYCGRSAAAGPPHLQPSAARPRWAGATRQGTGPPLLPRRNPRFSSAKAIAR